MYDIAKLDIALHFKTTITPSISDFIFSRIIRMRIRGETASVFKSGVMSDKSPSNRLQHTHTHTHNDY